MTVLTGCARVSATKTLLTPSRSSHYYLAVPYVPGPQPAPQSSAPLPLRSIGMTAPGLYGSSSRSDTAPCSPDRAPGRLKFAAIARECRCIVQMRPDSAQIARAEAQLRAYTSPIGAARAPIASDTAPVRPAEVPITPAVAPITVDRVAKQPDHTSMHADTAPVRAIQGSKPSRQRAIRADVEREPLAVAPVTSATYQITAAESRDATPQDRITLARRRSPPPKRTDPRASVRWQDAGP